MQLYAFQPTGYSALSFFVMASSEKEAREAVERHLAGEPGKENYDLADWRERSKDYVLTVAQAGVVVTNAND